MNQEVIKKGSKLKGKSNAIISNILVYRKIIKTLIDKSSQPNLITDSSYLQTEVVTKYRWKVHSISIELDHTSQMFLFVMKIDDHSSDTNIFGILSWISRSENWSFKYRSARFLDSSCTVVKLLELQLIAPWHISSSLVSSQLHSNVVYLSNNRSAFVGSLWHMEVVGAAGRANVGRFETSIVNWESGTWEEESRTPQSSL